jgi:hypothetical protein
MAFVNCNTCHDGGNAFLATLTFQSHHRWRTNETTIRIVVAVEDTPRSPHVFHEVWCLVE